MKILLVIMLVSFNLPAHAWKGEDVDSGELVNIRGAEGDISDGDAVVVYSQESADEYFSGRVISMFGFGREVQVEIREEEFGDRKIFNMQK